MRPALRIENASSGGLWWRIPLALFLWLWVAVPAIAGLITILTLRSHSEGLPSVPHLQAWADNAPRSNTIVAADGTLLAVLSFRKGKRSGHRFPLRIEEVPPLLTNAILAAEDIRFFEHRGVDPRAVLRSAWKNYKAGHVVEGASTITQQLARNLVPDIGNERSLRRKIREALLARRIERHYSKAEILESYVNFVFLGSGAYGFAAAARNYFSKTVDELSVAEAALLAGLIQSPGRGNPYNEPVLAMRRRNVILERMYKAGMIDDAEIEHAKKSELALQPPIKRYGHFAPWATEHARQTAQALMPDSFARGGLTIHTTISPQTAIAAEVVATRHVQSLPNDQEEIPQVAALVFDHRNGYISVLVGGSNWQHNQFNRATQGCRQPGSAFKAMVYGAALESNVITPATPLRDGPISEYDPELLVFWKPSNSGREFRGLAIAQDAVASSLNTPAVEVFDQVGSSAVVEFSLRMGLTSPLRENRPLALGASCVIPMELANAFAIIANDGNSSTPKIVKAIDDRGTMRLDRTDFADPYLSADRRLDRLAQSQSVPTARVLDAQTAYQLRSMLRAVVTRGTGRAAKKMPMPVAGKTGTTNRNVDAWFVGFSSRMTGAVWLGHDDPHKTLGRGRDGSHAALPLWQTIMTLAHQGSEGEVPGIPPKGLISAKIDKKTGLLAAPNTSSALTLYFKAGTMPSEMTGQATQAGHDFARRSSSF